jgi:hypothetical protein
MHDLTASLRAPPIVPHPPKRRGARAIQPSRRSLLAILLAQVLLFAANAATASGQSDGRPAADLQKELVIDYWLIRQGEPTTATGAAGLGESLAWTAIPLLICTHADSWCTVKTVSSILAKTRLRLDSEATRARDSARSEREQFNAIIDAFLTVAPSGLTKSVWTGIARKGAEAFVMTGVEGRADFVDMVRAFRREGATNDIDYTDARKFLGLAVDVCRDKNAYCLVSKMVSGVDWTLTPELIKQISPEIRHYLEQAAMRKAMDAGFSGVQEKLKDIETGLFLMFDHLAQLQNEQLEQLKKINAWIDNEEKRREEERRAAERRRRIQAVHAGIYILATIARPLDPKLANEINVVGNAMVGIYDAVDTFSRELRQLQVDAAAGTAPPGDLRLAAGVSTVIMTANVLQAALTIASLFEEQPEDVMLQQISELRQDLNELGVVMEARFARVDAMLVEIYRSMTAAFERLDQGLGEVRVAIAVLSDDLERTMTRVEAGLYEAVIDAARQDNLVEPINRNAGSTELSEDTFDQIANDLYSWANNWAANATSTGRQDGREITNGRILNELKKVPLDRNIAYVGRIVQDRLGISNLLAADTVNPAEWALASRAFARLIIDRPELARTRRDDLINQLDALIAHGERARTALHGLAGVLKRHESPIGASGAPTLVMTLQGDSLAAAGDFYLGRLDAVFAAIEDLRLAQTARPPRVDPFGPTEQPVWFGEPHARSIESCTTPHPGWPVLQAREDHLASAMFPPGMLIDYSIAPSPTYFYCYNANFFDFKLVGDGCCQWEHARLRIELRGYFENELVSRRAVLTPHIPSDDVRGALAREWPKFQNRLLSLNGSPDEHSVEGNAGARATEYAAKVLKREQQVLYDTVADQAAALDKPLHARIDELGGAKALIEALTALTLPRALQSDDRLRAALYGRDRLIDDEPASVIRGFGQPVANLNATGDQLTHSLQSLEADGQNAFPVLKGRWQDRVDEFFAAATLHLRPIQTGDALDSPVTINTTLNELALAKRMLTSVPAEDKDGGCGALGVVPLALGLVLGVRLGARRAFRRLMTGRADVVRRPVDRGAFGVARWSPWRERRASARTWFREVGPRRL